jgi:sodium-dependent dicarboxylate transporter 2/3/5
MLSIPRRTIKQLIVGAAVLAFAVLVPGEATGLGLLFPELAQQRAVAIFLVAVAFWVTNVIPPPATGLLVITLIPLVGVMERKAAFALFGNTAVFFILGVFLLASAMIRTGLSGRLTLLFLQRFDATPMRLVTGTICSAAFLSLWMPEHAVAAMMFPIVLEVAQSLRLEKHHSDFGKMLFLGLAWGATIGGIGTYLGGARAPLALSLMQEHSPELNISFLRWMTASMPIVVIMTGVAVGVIRWRLKPEVADIKRATQMLDMRVRGLGPMSGKEKRLAGLGVLTIVAWITLGHAVGLGVVATGSAVMLFVLRIVNWREVEEYVNWGVIMMYGGAIALGSALDDTGAMKWLAQEVIPPGAPPFALIVVMVVGAFGLTESISNSAAVAILLPIGYAICDSQGLSIEVMTLAVTIPAGLAFMLPISSPCNALSFSSGYYSMREAVSIGIYMSGISIVVSLLCMKFYWPLVGFSL